MLQSVVGGALELDHWRCGSWNEPLGAKCGGVGVVGGGSMEVVQPRSHMQCISNRSLSSSSSSSSTTTQMKSLLQLPAWNVLARPDLASCDVMEYEGPPTRVYMDAEVVDPLATDWPDDAADDLVDVEWPNLPCGSPLILQENSSCSNGDVDQPENNGQLQNCAEKQQLASNIIPASPSEVCVPESISTCTGRTCSSSPAVGIMAAAEATIPADSSSQAAAAAAAPYLLDGNLRAMLKRVTANEACLNKAIQGFGGGEKGMKVLLEYIRSWVREQKDTNVPIVLQHCLEQLNRQLGPERSVAAAAASEHHLFPLPAAAADAASQDDDFTARLSKSPDFEAPGSSYASCSGSSYAGVAHSESVPRDHPRSWQLGLLEQQWQQRLQQYAEFCNRRQPQAAMTSFGSIMADVAYNAQVAAEILVGPYPSSSAHGLQVPSVSPSIPSQLQQAAAELCCQAGMRSTQQTAVSLHSLRSNFKPIPSVSKQATAITMRAARKNRMAARQRDHSVPRRYNRNATNQLGSCCASSISTALQPGDLKKLQMQQDLTFASQGQGRNMDALLFLLHKELRPSDVSNLGRIVLPKKEAEHHLPVLTAREGQAIAMEDFDSGKIWTFRFRFWPNNKSRMYLLEITGDFVKAHHLQEGDLLIVYRNVQQGNYVVRGEKKVALAGARKPNIVTAKSMQQVD